MTSERTIALVVAILSVGLSSPVLAKDIQVRMKNRGADGMMVFEPSYVKAEVGDVVTFVPTDASHNAESIPGIAPKGTAAFKGAMNKPVAFTATKPGLYGVKCLPHLSMGMVALVQVGKVSSGDLANARAVKLPALAAKRMTAALTLVK